MAIESFLQRQTKIFNGDRMRADQTGEVAAQAGRAGLGGAGDPCEVAPVSRMASGRQKERCDHDVAPVETGRCELVREQRQVEREIGAIRRLHRRGGQRSDGGAEFDASLRSHAVAQIGRCAGRSAMIDDNDGGAAQGASGGRFTHPGGHDIRQGAAGIVRGRAETFGEGKRKTIAFASQAVEVAGAERRPDRTLRA